MRIRIIAIAVLVGLGLGLSGCSVSVVERGPGSPSPTALPFPDAAGPSLAPLDPPFSSAVLDLVVVETSQTLDTVTFMFTGRPQCSVRRLQSLPAGSAPVEGSAFLEVTCSPAVGPQRGSGEDPAQMLAGQLAAQAGRASNPAAVNVTEAVITSDRGGVLVWTIGLRHSAPWGVGSMSGDRDGGPIVAVGQ